MAQRFNPAPGWPGAFAGWMPFEGWAPDPTWPSAPEGWQLVVDDQPTSGLNGFSDRIRSATQDFTARSSSKTSVLGGPSDILWSVKSQPLPGIGGGRYRLTATTLYFERGTLTTNAQQVPTNQLYDIDLRQSLTQKARGVGDVLVHIQRGAGVEQVPLNDVPKPRAVNIINQVANQARINAHTMANTRHFTSNTGPSAPVQPAAPAASEPDVIEQLTKLGQLRDAVLLTEDEFAEKKISILARM